MTTCGPWNQAPPLPMSTRSTSRSPWTTFSMYAWPEDSVSSSRTFDGVPQRSDTCPPGSESLT